MGSEAVHAFEEKSTMNSAAGMPEHTTCRRFRVFRCCTPSGAAMPGLDYGLSEMGSTDAVHCLQNGEHRPARQTC